MATDENSINTDADTIKNAVLQQKQYFSEGHTLSINYRIEALNKLKHGLKKYEKSLIDAIYRDFKKPELETYATEIAQVYKEIAFTINKIKKWSKKRRVPAAKISWPARHYICPEPYGVVYIIGAWNYPVLLILLPLIGAIAAGNCVILKPSELTENTSRVIRAMMETLFRPEQIKVIEGGIDVSKTLLDQKFDYIFFTGSSNVGKIVMRAAAEKLIPVTLELGGKSPCIVDEDADPYVSASRIIFGKYLNAGQTCIAPDYVYVHKSIKQEFVDAFEQILKKRYGKNPKDSSDYTRIINKQHFERLNHFLLNGNVLLGGETDIKEYYIAPTLLDNVTWEDDVMQEEIFGPVLPLMEFEHLGELLASLNEKEKPLAAYYFSKSKNKQEQFTRTLKFGGGCINDTIFHFGNPHLPVGGAGNSGMGRYHGKYSFDTFSHLKGMVKKPFAFDLNLRYPPYKGKLKWIKLILKL